MNQCLYLRVSLLVFFHSLGELDQVKGRKKWTIHIIFDLCVLPVRLHHQRHYANSWICGFCDFVCVYITYNGNNSDGSVYPISKMWQRKRQMRKKSQILSAKAESCTHVHINLFIEGHRVVWRSKPLLRIQREYLFMFARWRVKRVRKENTSHQPTATSQEPLGTSDERNGMCTHCVNRTGARECNGYSSSSSSSFFFFALRNTFINAFCVTVWRCSDSLPLVESQST